MEFVLGSGESGVFLSEFVFSVLGFFFFSLFRFSLLLVAVIFSVFVVQGLKVIALIQDLWSWFRVIIRFSVKDYTVIRLFLFFVITQRSLGFQYTQSRFLKQFFMSLRRSMESKWKTRRQSFWLIQVRCRSSGEKVNSLRGFSFIVYLVSGLRGVLFLAAQTAKFSFCLSRLYWGGVEAYGWLTLYRYRWSLACDVRNRFFDLGSYFRYVILVLLISRCQGRRWGLGEGNRSLVDFFFILVFRDGREIWFEFFRRGVFLLG